MHPMTNGLIIAIAQSAVLVALSFFVILCAKKHESHNLSIFGYSVAVFLWIAAILIVTGSLFSPMGYPPMETGRWGLGATENFGNRVPVNGMQRPFDSEKMTGFVPDRGVPSYRVEDADLKNDSHPESASPVDKKETDRPFKK